jgi:hypothetical protein
MNKFGRMFILTVVILSGPANAGTLFFGDNVIESYAFESRSAADIFSILPGDPDLKNTVELFEVAIAAIGNVSQAKIRVLLVGSSYADASALVHDIQSGRSVTCNGDTGGTSANRICRHFAVHFDKSSQ